MKKSLNILLAVVLIWGLTGCGGSPAQSDPSSQSSQNISSSEQTEEKVFKMGETWTVDGQWSLTVNSVEEVSERNPYDERNPAAVYIVNYTYTNLGYKDENGIMDGLFFGMDNTIVDSANVMGYSYPGEITNYPTEVPNGATCNAQSCIGVENKGSFQITQTLYDGNGNKQTATFIIETE